MRQVDRAGLLAASQDPMVHHHLDLALVRRAWVDGPAAVVVQDVTWADAPPGALALLCLGPPTVLDPLMARVAAVEPRPWRLSVEAGSQDALPSTWRQARPHRWHWMTTTATPPASPDGPPVAVAAPDEVDAVLDVANAGSFARPGTPGLEVWLGARAADGRVAAVGALLRQGDGTGHLRGISTLPEHRGRGLAAAVTTALTTRALTGGTGLATLGVYTDNHVAVRLYRRLGYDVVHTFASGLVLADVTDLTR